MIMVIYEGNVMVIGWSPISVLQFSSVWLAFIIEAGPFRNAYYDDKHCAYVFMKHSNMGQFKQLLVHC